MRTKTKHPKFSKRKKKLAKKNDTVKYEKYTIGLDVALAYNFALIPAPKINDTDCKLAKDFKEHRLKEGDGALFPKPEEKLALLRTYMETSLHSGAQPVLLYYEGAVEKDRGTKDIRERIYHLDIVGTNKSVAEALIIQTSIATLEEAGFENLILEINSLGDKESAARFARELSNYYREHLPELPAACREKAKKNVFELLSCSHEKCQVLKNNAPHPINYLSEVGRTHFKELLEYIEASGIAYKINDSLVNDKDYCSHTVYKIIGSDTADKENKIVTLGVGIRYNALTKLAGLKKEMGATGITIRFRKKDAEKVSAKKIKPIQFYLIHMGEEAKHVSLRLIEMLRKEGIRVCHTITRDKLGAQLSLAEQGPITHLIIMGQKEFHENVVLVRRTKDRCQETVKLVDLPSYLRKVAIKG